VLISTMAAQVLPKGVPPEYGDPAKTPLRVDTSEAPFHLKIRKP